MPRVTRKRKPEGKRKEKNVANPLTQAVTGSKADSSQVSILSTWSLGVSEVPIRLAEFIPNKISFDATWKRESMCINLNLPPMDENHSEP